MIHEKLLTLLGFCRKAGKLVVGTGRVTELIQKGGYALVLVASDISSKSEKELRFAAAKGKAVVERVNFTTAQISKAIGTPAGIVATADDGFCKAILQGGNN